MHERNSHGADRPPRDRDRSLNFPHWGLRVRRCEMAETEEGFFFQRRLSQSAQAPDQTTVSLPQVSPQTTSHHLPLPYRESQMRGRVSLIKAGKLSLRDTDVYACCPSCCAEDGGGKFEPSFVRKRDCTQGDPGGVSQSSIRHKPSFQRVIDPCWFESHNPSRGWHDYHSSALHKPSSHKWVPRWQLGTS